MYAYYEVGPKYGAPQYPYEKRFVEGDHRRPGAGLSGGGGARRAKAGEPTARRDGGPRAPRGTRKPAQTFP